MMYVFTPVGKSATISPRRMIKPEIGLFTKMTWRWNRNEKMQWKRSPQSMTKRDCSKMDGGTEMTKYREREVPRA